MKHIEIINEMMANDFFSQWLGIKIIKQEIGSCKLSLIIKKEIVAINIPQKKWSAFNF